MSATVSSDGEQSVRAFLQKAWSGHLIVAFCSLMFAGLALHNHIPHGMALFSIGAFLGTWAGTMAFACNLIRKQDQLAEVLDS